LQEAIPLAARAPQRTLAVAAIGLALVVLGGSIYNILPLITAGAVDKLGFSAGQAGAMSSVLTFAAGVSAIMAGAWVRSLSWRRGAAVALGGMCATCLAAMLTHGYGAVVLLLGLAGFLASAAFSLGMTVLSDGRESARGFGVAIATQSAYQIAALWAGPSLLRLSGLVGVLALLAIPSGLGVALAPLLPAAGRAVQTRGAAKGLARPATMAAFIGFTAFFIGAGAYWTYLELMGQAQGITPQQVGNWSAIAVAAGIPGGVLASLQGDRFGNLRPLLLVCALILTAAALLRGLHGATAFGVAGAVYYFAWCYGVAYQYALVNAVDPTGRAVAITGGGAFFGSAGGAALAAFFVTPHDYSAVAWIVAVTICVSTAMFAIAAALHKRDDRAASP
jgi:MFS transporter, DHA1 family, inner membrane transport protein